MGSPRRKVRRARTLSGALEYVRTVFECGSCRATLAPIDVELGVAPLARMTRGMVRKVAYAASRGAYEQAARDLRELAGIEVSASEFARVALEEGERLDTLQREREAVLLAPVDPLRPTARPEIACERLVIEADATTVPTMADEEHKSVYCAVAFGLESRGRKEASGRPFITEKRYAASGKSMEDFGPRLKALAWRMGLRQTEHVAFVADGAPCLWRWAEENLPLGTVLIQDFWHVCEHLAELAQALFSTRWRGRFLRWKRKLRAGRIDSILRSLRRERRRHYGEARTVIDAKLHYLKNGRARMDYARFERAGWPIGSGAVEATCKHLVKERFCVTGAHWRRENIPRMLALRLSVANDEWQEDWTNQKAA